MKQPPRSGRPSSACRSGHLHRKRSSVSAPNRLRREIEQQVTHLLGRLAEQPERITQPEKTPAPAHTNTQAELDDVLNTQPLDEDRCQKPDLQAGTGAIRRHRQRRIRNRAPAAAVRGVRMHGRTQCGAAAKCRLRRAGDAPDGAFAAQERTDHWKGRFGMTDEKPRVIIIPPKPELQQTAAVTKQLRVAAYCRVSTKEEEQASSYEAQCEYYTDKIMSNKEWTMAGIFADEGITGTSTKKRTEFLAHDPSVQAEKDRPHPHKVHSAVSPATRSTASTTRASSDSLALGFSSRKRISILCRQTANL